MEGGVRSRTQRRSGPAGKRFEGNERLGTVRFGRSGRFGSMAVGGACRGRTGRVWKMGDVVYLLIVAAFFALAIGYARVAPRL